MDERVYLAIDLKSFYASVECVERGLDPLSTNLVVADGSKTEKTICLAVSPSLKQLGIPGRARLFEVVQKVKEANALRLGRCPDRKFTGRSIFQEELEQCPELAIDYVVAPPQMAHYMDFSTKIYKIYLQYVAPEDIHAYSIDEVFVDVTNYLGVHGMQPRELARTMILDVLQQTGITATAGIGTNLYLCKIAMDIEAKHIAPDENGVRIAELDEQSYRRRLWDHEPITDFWRVGRGYAKKLAQYGLVTMGDVARCSIESEELLYRLFGVNAELLIDHAWGYEPCTIADIKSYRPQSSSLGAGQVLEQPYRFDKARIVIQEMADQLALSLLEKRLVTNQLVLTVGYDVDNLKEGAGHYDGEIVIDRYGRAIPKQAHGTRTLSGHTNLGQSIIAETLSLFEEIVNPALLVRRFNLTANHVISEEEYRRRPVCEQLSLFDFMTPDGEEARLAAERTGQQERERRAQEAVLAIKQKFGKNAILRGTSLQDGATARSRNKTIGGHKA